MAKIKLFAVLFALTLLTACDYQAVKDLREERQERAYRAAMNDYQAGRVKQAIEGFRKAIKVNPANANARFQLACLLQDVEHDYLGAVWCLLEYLSQHPESDKTALAKTRLAVCERELAKALAGKYSLASKPASDEAYDGLRKELQSRTERLTAAEKKLDELTKRNRSLENENGRLLRLTGDVDAAESGAPVMKDAKTLLEEVDEDEAADSHESEIAALQDEEKAERALGTSLLAGHTAGEKAARDAARAEKKEAAEKAAAEKAARPEFYVVEEGDSLYKIALRFYGTKQAWKKILDANKATISSDARVKTGQKLRLP